MVVMPVVFTTTSVVVLAPPARLVPEVADSEIKEGVPAARAALQFNGRLPVLLIVIGSETVPLDTLMEATGGLTLSVAGAVISSVIVITWGLPTALPVTLSTAVTLTEPV